MRSPSIPFASILCVLSCSTATLAGCASAEEPTSVASALDERGSAAAGADDEAEAAARLGVDHLKPHGRFLHCVDGSSASAELLLAETDAGSFTLAMREKAYEGHTLGVLLETTIDPAFSNASRGSYLALTARVPSCRFSAASSTLVDCAAVAVSLSDGTSQKALADTTLQLASEDRVSDTVQLGHSDEVIFSFSLENAEHPFPTNYTNQTAFDPRSCTSR